MQVRQTRNQKVRRGAEVLASSVTLNALGASGGNIRLVLSDDQTFFVLALEWTPYAGHEDVGAMQAARSWDLGRDLHPGLSLSLFGLEHHAHPAGMIFPLGQEYLALTVYYHGGGDPGLGEAAVGTGGEMPLVRK